MRSVGHASSAVREVHRAATRRWPPHATFNERRSVASLVVSVVLSAWWLLGLKFPYLFFGPGAANLNWGAAMDRLYPVLAIAQVLWFTDRFMKLGKPTHTRFARVIEFAWLITGAFFIYSVATSDYQWMVWRASAAVGVPPTAVIAGRELTTLTIANHSLSIAFILVAVGGVVQALRALVRWVSGRGLQGALLV
jgi:hypothetical protein